MLLPLLLPIHPFHPVTSSHTPHLSRRFTSWPLTPPPSTVHNVQTPCRPQRGGHVRGLCLSCRTHTIRRPPAPIGPSHHVRTQWCGPACIHVYTYIIVSLCSSLYSSPSTLFTLSHRHRFTSWPLTPPPRSDSTVHNVQTPCRAQRGGHVRGLCLSCRTHTIRRPPAPIGPSHHVRTQWCRPACIIIIL